MRTRRPCAFLARGAPFGWSLALAAFLCSRFQPIVVAMCPSQCNGHGTCNSLNNCVCFEGYTGFDCYKRQCPFGVPWAGFAVADDDVRSVSAECSNRGKCNRGSGRCECDPAFMGHACDRLRIGCGQSNLCNGHGQCVSMKQLAAMAPNDYNLFHTATYTTPWDAERIFGCVCDYGYAGVDCMQRMCAFGDDPMTTGQQDEIQALSCLCASCTGTFTLSFRGATTRALDVVSETALSIKTALEALPTIRSVGVAFDGGSKVCDADGVSTRITFLLEHGDVPALVVDASLVVGAVGNPLTLQTGGAAALYGTGAATQTGTKEWLPCSGRGTCNTLNGQCVCDTGFDLSDGMGGQGIINDCGYRSGGVMTTCAGGATGSSIRCSGHGRCSGSPNYKCQCDNTFMGSICNLRSCPLGRAWFEEAQVNDVAHFNSFQCSNAGACGGSGRCTCTEGFAGAACDRMACPSTSDGTCANRGSCKTTRELAALTPSLTDFSTTAGFIYGSDPNAMATWDADMIQGCYCDKVHTHRSTNVRYSGHNCAKIPCPSGDDPWTSSQVDEVQTVSCTADGGSFTLTFRGETTRQIPFSASTSQVETALESLRTITSVDVVFSTGVTTACAPAGNVITITFHSPAGDLPLLTVSTAQLMHLSGTVTMNVAQVTAGSREDTECNNRGRCDEDSGTCICELHHTSSDAQGSIGLLNDCGAVDEFAKRGRL